MEKAYVCKIPLEPTHCERISKKCESCEYKDKCDYYWVADIWEKDNKKQGDNITLGVCLPIIVKKNMRAGFIISVTGKYDFCMFNIPVRSNSAKNNYVIISDIFVSEEVRGQHLAKKLLTYLMETYDRDIFAKCVKDSSAEKFWKHVGKQIDANSDSINPNHSLYEQRPGKRDLGWYVVENKNKRNIKQELF